MNNEITSLLCGYKKQLKSNYLLSRLLMKSTSLITGYDRDFQDSVRTGLRRFKELRYIRSSSRLQELLELLEEEKLKSVPVLIYANKQVWIILFIYFSSLISSSDLEEIQWWNVMCKMFGVRRTTKLNFISADQLFFFQLICENHSSKVSMVFQVSYQSSQ